MDESEIREAIAQQEEHLKRSKSCREVPGTAHSFSTFGAPSTDRTIASSAMWQACIVCGVTETDDDYQIRLAATGI